MDKSKMMSAVNGKKDLTVGINSLYKSFFNGANPGSANLSYSSGTYTKVND